jgi:hypothetical protein
MMFLSRYASRARRPRVRRAGRWVPRHEALENRTLLSYSYRALDFPSAIYTQATAINDAGQVAGNYLDSGGFIHGFLYDEHSLLVYNPIDYPGAADTEPTAINDLGQITGWYIDAGGQHGFLYSAGTYTKIDPPGTQETQPTAINNSGQIVGWYLAGSPIQGTVTGFLYDGGQYDAIAPPGAIADTEPTSINDLGQIVGYYIGSDGIHGFEKDAAGFSTIDFPNEAGTEPSAINNAGQIVGTYGSTIDPGFLDDNGTFSTVVLTDGSGTQPTAINDLGQIVGNYVDSSGVTHGFMNDKSGDTTIGPSQATYAVASGVNHSGQIVGFYYDASGGGYGYVATPLQTDLAVTSLEWNTARGGADFAYTISGDNLTEPTTTALFWSPDPTFDAVRDTLIGGSVTATATGASTVPYSVHIDGATFGMPPTGSKYLLAVIDPADTVSETDDPHDANDVASVAYDPIAMQSATSPDSKGIAFTYDISEADPGQTITVGIYRSADSSFNPDTAILVNEKTIPALDQAGGSSEAIGSHGVVIQDAAALYPDPHHEFVFVVADPGHDIGDPQGTYHEAHYRKFVLGVVVHGLQLLGQVTSLPSWETTMAADLQRFDRFDSVLPFDWSSESKLPLPGVTQAEGLLLAVSIRFAADIMILNQGSGGDVVDLDLIGHSRGAVVISQALQDLLGTTDPALAGGYKTMTLLDPHPANNSFAAQTASFGSNFFAQRVVKPAYVAFQAAAADPQVVIPPNVDQADLYFQHTPAQAFPVLPNFEAIVNLWGEDQSLIINQSSAHLGILDLTGTVDASLGFIGHSEVPLWYDEWVVRTGKVFAGY